MKRSLQCKVRTLPVIVVVAWFSTLASHVLADETKGIETTTHGDEYGYKFKDESLLGSTLAAGGDIYKSRKGFHRVLLIRPRTDLIPQLFKSVENL